MKLKHVALALALVSPAAMAQMSMGGFYVGGSLGKSSTRFDANDFSSGSALISESRDRRDTAWKFFVGYNINQNFAVEGGYADLGEPAYRYSSAIGGGRAEIENRSWFLAGKGTFQAGPVGLFGKLGLTQNRSKLSATGDTAAVNAILGTPFGGRDDRNSWLWGIGAEYKFNRNVGLRMEYEDFGKFGDTNSTGRTKADMWSVGVTYAF
jgi:OOP family OmpA-OmpF porin